MTQGVAREFAMEHFAGRLTGLERLLPVFEHAGIDHRHLCVPPEWFRTPRGPAEKNQLYVEWSTRLASEVLRQLVAAAGVGLEEITHVLFVSTTGLATPSIDARVINALGLSPHVGRTPVWGLGCAGGAAGLGLAHRLSRGDPDSLVALICVELCSLTFHFADFSRSNFVATALFADGAAGALVAGEARAARIRAAGPTILDARSTTWPDTLNVMGWNFDDVGMQVVFAQAIPQIVREKSRENIGEFLRSHGLGFDDLRHFVAHPGGVRVIEAYEEVIPMPSGGMADARAILREYGNISSASVLFVLRRTIDNGHAQPRDLGLLTALGPGFSSEQLLLRF